MNNYSFIEGNEPNDSDYAPIEFKSDIEPKKNPTVLESEKKTVVSKTSKKECFPPMLKMIIIGILAYYFFQILFPEEKNNTSNLALLSKNLNEITSFLN